MVFPSPACITCKKRRVKVRLFSMNIMSILMTSSVTPHGQIAVNAAKEPEVVYGKLTKPESGNLKARMLLQKGNLGGLGQAVRSYVQDLLCSTSQHPLRLPFQCQWRYTH